MNGNTKGNAHVSCNCRACKGSPSKVKGEHKRVSHRALRHATKAALRKGGESPARVSSGYKA